MRKLLLIELKPAERAVIAAGLLIFLVFSALIGDYAVANWRASQAVHRSQQDLCEVISLVTAKPVPKPANPAADPSRETSYRFYLAFLDVGRRYDCQEVYP